MISAIVPFRDWSLERLDACISRLRSYSLIDEIILVDFGSAEPIGTVPGCRVVRVEAHREIGQLEDAAETARQAGEPALQAELLEELGDYYGAAESLLTLSRDDEASELLTRVPDDHPDHPAAMLVALLHQVMASALSGAIYFAAGFVL